MPRKESHRKGTLPPYTKESIKLLVEINVSLIRGLALATICISALASLFLSVRETSQGSF